MTPLRLLPFPLLLVAALACGDGDESAAGAPAAATAGATGPGADTTAGVADTAAARPAIPADFPSDFPLPPDHEVLDAATSRDVSGTYSTARLAVAGDDVEASFAWYRQALADAGWQISAEGRAAGSRTLHAMQGESYVDLTVMPDPDRFGRIVIDASIWKVEAL